MANSAFSKGAIQTATASDINAGTSTTLANTPDALAGSYAGTKNITLYVIEAVTPVSTGDGKIYFRVPMTLNGMNLVMVGASINTTSSSGTPTFSIERGRQANATTAHAYVDMLSTSITIDVGEYDSQYATTSPVINTSNDDVLTGDLIRINVDTAGTGTAGLEVTLAFQLP